MKALIVEDEPQTIEAFSPIFKLRWPEVELLSITRGSEAALMVEKESPDVVILDLGLPDVDGIEVLKEIRAFSDVLVIIVTARGDSISQVKGLELGADDYVTKPFDPGVLLVRVKNALAHARIPLNQAAAPFSAGDLIIDFAEHEVRVAGNLVDITPTEYRLLSHLARNAGRVLTYRNLLETVWGEGYEDTSVLKTCVYRLRKKLVQAGAKPDIIISEHDTGYKLNVSR